MSSFSPRWLALREPFDHAARSEALLKHLRLRPGFHGLELGCGTGSGVRWLQPRLPKGRWTLVDHDPVLLEQVQEGATLCHDLRDLDGLPGADLVSCQALLDLVSWGWLVKFADWLAERRVPLLAALTVDGDVAWSPPHPADRMVQAAFRAHQLTDRGFGVGPGSAATEALTELLCERGFSVHTAPSPWWIPPEAREMLRAMVEGTAQAAAEMAGEAMVAPWRSDRLRDLDAGRLGLRVGHRDLLASPGARVHTRRGEAYLAGYSRTDIHAEMLEDRARTNAYRRALLDLDLRGKTVLDVGAGTGILSLFAAQAGAERVYAVEASELASTTAAIVRANGLEDRITVIPCPVEEVELPGPVDVIVSEWMGYFLLFERMLDGVLTARDRWLAPGGTLLPRTARLKLFGIEDFQHVANRIAWWDDVYGFDLSPMAERSLKEAVVEPVDPRAIVTGEATVLDLDLATMERSAQDFRSSFELRARRTDHLHAIVGAFEVGFHGDLVLATDPSSEPTHWKQTVFYLDRPLELRKGERICGTIAVTADPHNPRGLSIALDLRTESERRTGRYRL